MQGVNFQMPTGGQFSSAVDMPPRISPRPDVARSVRTAEPKCTSRGHHLTRRRLGRWRRSDGRHQVGPFPRRTDSACKSLVRLLTVFAPTHNDEGAPPPRGRHPSRLPSTDGSGPGELCANGADMHHSPHSLDRPDALAEPPDGAATPHRPCRPSCPGAVGPASVLRIGRRRL